MDAIIYYECKKLGHVKQDCLNVKKRPKFNKKKEEEALKASTWDDEDDNATSSKDDDDDLGLEELAKL